MSTPEMILFEKDPAYVFTDFENKRMRVAAYARVSTDSAEQETSFELQTGYYRKFVGEHPTWTLVDVYADEGLSATSTRKRDNFNRMIRDCEKGKIDLIICKNVSRFSRNVVDCLGIARKLIGLPHPVGIYFEEQKINTLTRQNEMMLQVLAMLAQWESQAKSD